MIWSFPRNQLAPAANASDLTSDLVETIRIGRVGGLRPHLADQGGSVHVRHLVVGHEGVASALSVLLQSLAAVLDGDDLRRGQGVLHHSGQSLENPFMIVGHDHAGTSAAEFEALIFR